MCIFGFPPTERHSCWSKSDVIVSGLIISSSAAPQTVKPWNNKPLYNERLFCLPQSAKKFDSPYTLPALHRGYTLFYRVHSTVYTNIDRGYCAHPWNIFQHSRGNFVSPSGHVMFYLLLKNQWNTKPFRLNSFFFAVKSAIYYVAIATEIFHEWVRQILKIMLFSYVTMSCFRANAHLVFHWCLYNK